MHLYTDPIRRDHNAGFTLIELLVVIAILSILAGLSLSAFRIHSRNAQFSRAQVTLGSARVALEAGQDYLESHPFVWEMSAADGRPLSASMQQTLPGLIVTKGIKVQTFSMFCGMGNKRMEMITVYACDAGYYTFWIRTCGGWDAFWPKSELPPGFC